MIEKGVQKNVKDSVPIDILFEKQNLQSLFDELEHLYRLLTMPFVSFEIKEFSPDLQLTH